MAGFLGMGSFAKEGKGVRKGESEKKRFFQFFDLYFLKFWKLLQLNLLFLIFCLPIVTIGPAIAALTKITRYYVEGKPVFLLSDFWDAFKENFLQGFIIGLIDAVLIAGSIQGFLYYMVKFHAGQWAYIILAVLTILVLVFVVFANFYVFLVSVTIKLKLFGVIKNAVMFIFIGARTNFLTLLFTGAVSAGCFLLLPYSVPIAILILFSTISLIANFNSYQYVYRFLIKPYYEENGIPNPYEPQDEDGEVIFQDTTV